MAFLKPSGDRTRNKVAIYVYSVCLHMLRIHEATYFDETFLYHIPYAFPE